MKDPAWLLEYSNNVYSQSGEDGIIRKVLSLLPETDKWCVEFGAWDGVYLNNARRLIEEDKYSAVLIEGDKDRFLELSENYAENNNVHPLCAFVGFTEKDSLDNLLEQSSIPQNFDFLSIDIDGNDYHVWKATKRYQPKVVCIEYNQTIPNEVEFVQPADPSVNQSSSLHSICMLGREKGYELVCVTDFNAIFVAKKYYHLFDISDNDPANLRKNLSYITWLFFGQDGTMHLSGCQKIPWHDIRITEKKIQIIPSCLRTYPPLFSLWQRGLFKYWSKLYSWFVQ